MLQQRQTGDTVVDPADKARRVNLLNWDGKGEGRDLLPPRAPGQSSPADVSGTDGVPGAMEPKP